MKLQKFDYQIKDNKKNKSFIGVSVLLVALAVGVVLYKSFAAYKVTESYNIIKGSVASFTVEPLKISYNLVGEDGGVMSTSEIPSKEEYEFDAANSTCVNGNNINYNVDTNTFTIGDGSEGIEDSCEIYFNFIPLSLRTLYALGYTSADIKTGIPYGPNGTGEPGFYAAEDDYGTSYYYYGFDSEWGTSPVFALDDYLYYLIRINGNGSLRMFEQDSIGAYDFNNSNNDNVYVGYMYGPSESYLDNTTSSSLKSWSEEIYNKRYERNESYLQYLDDVIFCNDRSLYIDEYGEKEADDTATGIGTNTTYYGAYYRLRNNTPSLKCINKEDSFTMDDEEKGNGKLDIPVGYMTADEAYMTNATWFYTDWWSEGNVTMTPAMFKDGIAYTYNFKSELFMDDVTNNDIRTHEVINIKYGLTYTGDGFETPYEIVE